MIEMQRKYLPVIIVGCIVLLAPTCSFFLVHGIPQSWTGGNANTVVQLDVLVAVYTHTAGGNITAADIDVLHREVDEARAFYFRNSRLALDLNVQYLVIDDYMPLSRFANLSGAYWLPPNDLDPYDQTFASVENDLRVRGVQDDEFAGVVVFYAWEHHAPHLAAYGGTTFGVDYGFLGHTSYTDIPLAWEPTTWDWYFIHEFNHQVDSMFDYSGYAKYQSADLPWTLAGDFGENYDYNAFFMRSLQRSDWFRLADSRWGHLAGIIDADHDGVPDTGNFSITEAKLGTSPSKVDTDGDGLSDLGEITEGILHGSNPLVNDTDKDGIPDNLDPFPLYPIDARALPGNLTTSHDLGGVPSWILNATTTPLAGDFYRVSFAATWNDTGVNMIARIPDNITKLTFHLDMNDDGWFHGRDNLEITVNLASATLTAKTWAADADVIGAFNVPVWDDEASYLARFNRVINASQVTFVEWIDGNYKNVKIRIPWIMTGVDMFGILARVDQFTPAKPQVWLFEEDNLVDITVGGR